jgi:hypothetical protein
MINAESFNLGLRIPLPTKANIPVLIDGLKRLIETPEEYRNQWAVNEEDDNLIERGLTERTGSGNSKDEKWWLHYTPLFIQDLLDRQVDFCEHARLLYWCNQLYQDAVTASEDYLFQLDSQYPEWRIKERFEACPEEGRHVLRVLYYKTGTSILAHPHFDRSFQTIHIAESHPGLMLRDKTEPYNVVANTGLLFPGLKAEYISNGVAKAMPHAVVATTTEERWAIVLFTHLYAGRGDSYFKTLTQTQMSNVPIPA